MIKKLIFIVTSLFCLESSSLEVAISDQENLSSRRILSLWREGERKIAVKMIDQHLTSYSESAFSDPFHLMAATYLIDGEQFQRALQRLLLIKEKRYRDQSYSKRLLCCEKREDYRELIDELSSQISPTEEGSADHSLDLLYGQALFSEATSYPKELDLEEALSQVKRIFNSLMETPQKYQAKLALAELFKYEEEIQKAIDLLWEGSVGLPDQRDEILMQIVVLQTPFSKEDALETLNLIIESEGRGASRAALYKASLLVEEGREIELLAEEEFLLSHCRGEELFQLKLLLGKTHNSAKNYRQAQEHLESLLEEKEIFQRKGKEILLALQSVYYSLENFDEVRRIRKELESHYPEDPLIANALLTESIFLKKRGAIKEALKLLQRVKEEYPLFPSIESVDLEIGTLYLLGGEPQVAREYLTRSLKEGTVDRKRFYLLISRSSMKRALQDKMKREALFTEAEEDLLRLVDGEELLDREERALKKIELAYLYSHYEKMEQAIVLLNELIDQHQEHKKIYSAHKLFSSISINYLNNTEKAVYHGEKALELGADFEGRDRFQYRVYQLYLKLSEELKDSTMIALGAEHLYQVFDREELEISDKELIALAGYYYKKVLDPHSDLVQLPLSKEIEEWALRAFKIYKRALYRSEEELLTVSRRSASFDQAYLKLATLYNAFGDFEAALTLLKQLSSGEQIDSKPLSKQSAQALYLLADTYRLLERREEALHYFSKLVKGKFPLSSYMKKRIKLNYAQLTLQQERLTEREIDHSLALLKKLIKTKKIAHEPLHLQAALDYAHHFSKLGSDQDFLTSYLELLNEVREEFVSQSDIFSKDYHNGRQQLEEKNEIYQNYLSLIDAEIHKTQALKGEEDLLGKEQRVEIANTLYHTIQHRSGEDYLRKKCEDGIKLLNVKFHRQTTQTIGESCDQ